MILPGSAGLAHPSVVSSWLGWGLADIRCPQWARLLSAVSLIFDHGLACSPSDWTGGSMRVSESLGLQLALYHFHCIL